MMLCLVKYSSPGLTNVIRELAKAYDGANPAAYKELLHMIKYVINTKNLGFKIKPMVNSNKPWEIICFSNSDYTEYPLCRQSMSG